MARLLIFNPSMPGKPFSLERVRGVIARERSLALLLPEADRLAELNRRLARALPPAIAAACRVAAVQGSTALVYCGNGAAASRLRSQAKTVAGQLADAATPIDDLKVKLRADWNLTPKPAKPGMAPPALAAWREFDAELPEGALKAAVDRLLAHHRGER